jgi:glycosyltransferase involved in cell wall biosynthesis
MSIEKNKILFIVQYPEKVAPGQRFRIEAYKNLLMREGFDISFSPFMSSKGSEVVYKKGYVFTKIRATIGGFVRRFMLLHSVRHFTVVFIYREITPIGPAFFEWLITKVYKKRVIYDFDDAIWLYFEQTESSFFTKIIKNKSKVKQIISWSSKISCGNEFLCNYARQFNKNVFYNPTCVDTENRYIPSKKKDNNQITIGWTGSFSTLNYIKNLEPVLRKLEKKYEFCLLIICNKKIDFALKSYEYIEWNEQNEIQDLSKIDIGLMPLENEIWSEGKCGFKLIQYMALEIPAVASPVGVNKKLLQNEDAGFLCSSEEQWYLALEKLINDQSLRERMGKNGRLIVSKQYSVKSNAENFLNLFN